MAMNKHSLIFKALLFYGASLPSHPRKWWLHDRLRHYFDVDVNEDFCVVRGRLKWLLNPADFVHTDVFWLGTKDVWDVYHLKRLFQPGSVFLDVGA